MGVLSTFYRGALEPQAMTVFANGEWNVALRLRDEWLTVIGAS